MRDWNESLSEEGGEAAVDKESASGEEAHFRMAHAWDWVVGAHLSRMGHRLLLRPTACRFCKSSLTVPGAVRKGLGAALGAVPKETWKAYPIEIGADRVLH